MQNIILIYPRVTPITFGRNVNIMPLSLLALGSALEEAGFEVRIIDERMIDRLTLTVREALTPETVCVGISTMTGYQIKGALEAACAMRRAKPDLLIVWGGVHPSLLPEQTLKNELVDVVVIGPGEETFLELVRTFVAGGHLERVRGIAFKQNGKTVITEPRAHPDLNAIPFPAYHQVPFDNYGSHLSEDNERTLPVMTSRGCPFRCGYCYNLAFN